MARTVTWLVLLFLSMAAALIPPAAAADAPRSFKAEVLFKLANPCPSTGETRGECKGYMIDRIIPIICGGAEEPANMQWQTIAEAKAKDKWERIGCRPGRKQLILDEPSITQAYPVEAPPPITEAAPLPID
jgi:hypothetical protein